MNSGLFEVRFSFCAGKTVPGMALAECMYSRIKNFHFFVKEVGFESKSIVRYHRYQEVSLGMVYLNAKCKQILQMLLESDTYISLQQIAKALHVSRRSIFYDVCRINEWLEGNGIPELEVVRGKGILLDDRVKHLIEDCAEDVGREEMYVFSPMERVRIIICSIIYSETPVYIDQLTDYCRVSRNTIFNDLRVVVNQLQDYDLNLEYKSKKGYLVSGDSIKKRAVFLLNFHELQSIFTNGGLKFIEIESIEKNIELLKAIEAELNVEYVAGNLESLAILLLMMGRGDEELYFANLKKQELKRTKEYVLIDKYFPQLIEKEKIYLCLHLLCSRVNHRADDIFENCTNQTVYEITKALVSEFERTACVAFDRREELERQLFVHISSSMYRYQYGIQFMNDMNDDIIREYPDLFEITKIVSRYLEEQIGLPIPDGEIAYLALHFGAFLSVPSRQSERTRILVVCANGVSTGKMLGRELKKMFQDVEIVGVKSASDLQNVQKICDLIVSTVKLKSVVPVVLVHPILTDHDRKTLLRYLKMNNQDERLRVDGIISAIKPYLKEGSDGQVRETLKEYLYHEEESLLIKKEETRNLLDILTGDKIGIHGESCRWTQALWMAADCLLETGSIRAGYIESILSQLRLYGPYMFITSGVILAHAKPETGVNCLDCSLHIFREGVEFSDSSKANVIIILAAVDQESHLKVLRDIVTVFSDEGAIQEILKSGDAAGVLKYLERKLRADGGQQDVQNPAQNHGN